MILRIDQVMSNGENRFEVRQEGQLLFLGSTPFIKPAAMIGGDYFRRLELTDAAGNLILYSTYDGLKNAVEAALPLSWLYKDSKQLQIYSILNNTDNVMGQFYYEQTAVADMKYVFSFMDRAIFCYVKGAGKKEVVSVYENERQIGQVTKPNCVRDNLDCYIAHFIDGELSPAMVSFFVIYFYYMRHSNSGRVRVGYTKNVSYTFDKNSKMYNKDFIRLNVGEEENDRLEQFIKDSFNTKKNKK